MVRRMLIPLLVVTVALSACADRSLTTKQPPNPVVEQAPPSTSEASARNLLRQVPGSARQYTQAQIDDYYAAPDWFPDQHPPMPKLVSHGDGGKILACASCHLTSGLGHPESGNLAGLPQSYLVRQMAEYKSRTRNEPSPMHTMAAAMSEQDMAVVSAYFSALQAVRSSRVQEVELVPATTIHPTLRMRQVVPGAAMEPINGRLIEVPDSAERVERRDPTAGFVAYVPQGSLASGKALVSVGDGRTIPCAACHGATLMGTADIPRLAGLSPDYVLRQLQAFKSGDRHGEQAPLMKPVVDNLSAADMLAIAAYVGSLGVETP